MSLDGSAKYFWIALLTPIIAYFLFSRKNASLRKSICHVIILILISSFIPLRLIDNHYFSIVQIIIRGHLLFLLMLIGYCINLLLLFTNSKTNYKIGFLIFIASFVLGLVNEFKLTGGWDSYIVYPADKYGYHAYLTSYLWLMLYTLLPGLIIILQGILITSRLERKRYLIKSTRK